jgi:hypothetical protein
MQISTLEGSEQLLTEEVRSHRHQLDCAQLEIASLRHQLECAQLEIASLRAAHPQATTISDLEQRVEMPNGEFDCARLENISLQAAHPQATTISESEQTVQMLKRELDSARLVIASLRANQLQTATISDLCKCVTNLTELSSFHAAAAVPLGCVITFDVFYMPNR